MPEDADDFDKSKNHWPLIERRSFLAQASACLLAGCGGGSSGSPPTVLPPLCLKLLVPAYFDKPAPWVDLAATSQPLVVIANAINGPGTVIDPLYQSWIAAVRAKGHRVKGYVYTRYGQRNASLVLADLDAWSRLYGINDYFLDEISVLATDLAYYRNILVSATTAAPTRRFMLNPGLTPDMGYFDLVPNLDILVFEGAWSSYRPTSLPSALDAVASQCWIMAQSASESQMKEVAALARSRRFAGFFATNLPYISGLPSYWAAQSALAVCG